MPAQKKNAIVRRLALIKLAALLVFSLALFCLSGTGHAGCDFNQYNDYVCGDKVNNPKPPDFKPPDPPKYEYFAIGSPFVFDTPGLIAIPIPGTDLCQLPAATIRIGTLTFNLSGNEAIECSSIRTNENDQLTVDPTPTTTTNTWCPSPGAGITATSPGDKIAQSANNSIGASTADVPGTDGGNLGCAIAVSRMLECAGCGVGSHLGTIDLYNSLDKDPCFQKVDTGTIDPSQLQPGDILVTKKASRSGHTGIYVGNGNIVSNSSGGFNGSAPGTVQQNYNTGSWNSGVVSRNPGGSAVFRRTCNC